MLFTVGSIGAALASNDHAELFERLTPEQEARVVSLIDDGQDAYDDGDFRAALGYFNQVYGLFPHPDVLYRVALCYERLGNAEMAIQQYRQFLDEVPDARERGRIERTIESLEDELGDDISTMRVESFPIGANIYIDDLNTAPVGQTPNTVTLAPGQYQIFVVKDGYQREEQFVDIDEAEHLRITLRLKETVVVDEGSDLQWWQPATTVTFVGIGGFALYQSMGHRAQAREYQSQIDSLDVGEDTEARRAELTSDQENERSMATNMGIFGGVTLAAATAFTVWWVIRAGKEDSASETSIGISPSPDGINVGIYGRF